MAPDLLLIRDQEAHQGFDQRMRQLCLHSSLSRRGCIALPRPPAPPCPRSAQPSFCAPIRSLADTGHDVSVSGGGDGGMPVTMPPQPCLDFSAAPLLHSAVGDATVPSHALLFGLAASASQAFHTRLRGNGTGQGMP